MEFGSLRMFCLDMMCVMVCVLEVSGHGSHGSSHQTQHPKRSRSTRPSRRKSLDVDDEHVKDHYKGVAEINETDMSPEELEFHFFKQHDLDNNTMLDGLEIYKSLTHFLPYEGSDDHAAKQAEQTTTDQERKTAEEKYYTEIIDSLLDEDDLNQDGYLSYAEYVIARRRQEAEFEKETGKHKQ